MARPRKVAVWEAEALEIGRSPEKILTKVKNLRRRKADKYEVTLPFIEAVWGWDLDEMAVSLVHAIRHERCRGPRCKRIAFKDLPLGLITCDVLNPADPPLWCVNIRWACEEDNKGDGPRSLSRRIDDLVRHRQQQFEALVVPAFEEQRLPGF